MSDGSTDRSLLLPPFPTQPTYLLNLGPIEYVLGPYTIPVTDRPSVVAADLLLIRSLDFDIFSAAVVLLVNTAPFFLALHF